MSKKTAWTTLLISNSSAFSVIELNHKPTLKEMQAWVGGLIQGLHVTYKGKRKIMWVNEEGLLLGQQVNGMASIIAGQPIVGFVFIPLDWRVS